MNSASKTLVPLRYVACISYPRSGHHLTVRIAKQYFAGEFNYCSFYDCTSETCCRSFPCQDASVTLTKNHDMDILRPDSSGVEKVSEVPYLILVRNYLDAVVSDYQLFLRDNEDSPAAWQGFSQRKIAYYRAFVRKWIMEEDSIEKLVVRYEDLTDNSLLSFRRIIKLFAPQRPIDVPRLRLLIDNAALEDVRPDQVRVIKRFGIHNRRRIEDFQHFNPETFRKLEEQVAPELQALGYASRYGGFELSRVS